MDLNEYPTVKQLRARATGEDESTKIRPRLQADWLRKLAMDCGADNAGLIDIDQEALDPQCSEILKHYPWPKTLLSFVVRMSREPIAVPRVLSRISSFITPAIWWMKTDGYILACRPEVASDVEIYA